MFPRLASLLPTTTGRIDGHHRRRRHHLGHPADDRRRGLAWLRTGQEGGIAQVRGVVALDEVPHVDTVLPRSRCEATPGLVVGRQRGVRGGGAFGGDGHRFSLWSSVIVTLSGETWDDLGPSGSSPSRDRDLGHVGLRVGTYVTPSGAQWAARAT